MSGCRAFPKEARHDVAQELWPDGILSTPQTRASEVRREFVGNLSVLDWPKGNCLRDSTRHERWIVLDNGTTSNHRGLLCHP